MDKAHYQAIFQQFLEELKIEETADRQSLVRLVNLLRPKDPKNSESAKMHFGSLLSVVVENPELAQKLKSLITNLFYSRNSVRTFTELGILSAAGFYGETWKKIVHEILPEAYPAGGLMQELHEIFHRKSDYLWIEAIPSSQWSALLSALGFLNTDSLPAKNAQLKQLLNSAMVLAQRITAIGIEPEIVEKMPEIEHFDSPFMVISREMTLYVDKLLQPGFERYPIDGDYKHIQVMLTQCEDYVKLIRKNKKRIGTSLSLTYALLRISQNIERLRLFLKMIHQVKKPHDFYHEIQFFKQLIKAENTKHSLRLHLSQNLGMLAFQITEHTSRKGLHYITKSRGEYWRMLRSALGGGFIVAFLCIFKNIITGFALAPFGRAFLYCLNYSGGFIIIHLTASTLATKQPAMTASRVAASMDEGEKHSRMHNLVDVLVRLSRTQFIAFLGNIIMAFPIAFALAWLYQYFAGEPFIDKMAVKKNLHDLNPHQSMALVHAAIAGVFLFLAGLISGYYDNLNIYAKISQRLQNHRVLKRVLKPRQLLALSSYLDQHLGPLAGNFYLGVFLGSAGTLGYFLGLPIDIRHVTFASGSFGLSLASLSTLPDIAVVLDSILGIFLIGFVNFVVSFGLTTLMALKSRNVHFRDSGLLLKTLLLRFGTNPSEFFYPPRGTEPAELALTPKPSRKL